MEQFGDENTYADFFPLNCHGDEYNYWGRRNLFWGRKPEEIRFKPGDIVEVMGYPGNHYWGNNSINLAIVVKAPPIVDETRNRLLFFPFHHEYNKILGINIGNSNKSSNFAAENIVEPFNH